MKALKGKPTKPGWYWVTGINGGSVWFIAEVWQSDHKLIMRDGQIYQFYFKLSNREDGYATRVWLNDASHRLIWYGPLKPPTARPKKSA